MEHQTDYKNIHVLRNNTTSKGAKPSLPSSSKETCTILVPISYSSFQTQSLCEEQDTNKLRLVSIPQNPPLITNPLPSAPCTF
ncbi:hypothetical protein NPIL_153261 [Nephila pilipes]|uniref:Uncharacterized protein n=1 Tax=Nephila pilipes TaxID=299642 RepID=A0A8X6PA00_NEPPI|nr:hypothetical protein NPIL_153261 [Nephila pilipes]